MVLKESPLHFNYGVAGLDPTINIFKQKESPLSRGLLLFPVKQLIHSAWLSWDRLWKLDRRGYNTPARKRESQSR
jgi:hypothetical protein